MADTGKGHEAQNPEPKQRSGKVKNRTILWGVLAVVAAMAALAYASVPLYDLFCRVTGYGGTTQVRADAPEATAIVDREITVNFNADTSARLPWVFAPDQRAVKVRLGQEALISYSAKNRAARPNAGTALYNVTPAKAGRYFHKVQCFCFDEQILQPGQKVVMPVLFYIDPALDEDKSLDELKRITLSYNFFPAESEELDTALEDFYNGASGAAAQTGEVPGGEGGGNAQITGADTDTNTGAGEKSR